MNQIKGILFSVICVAFLEAIIILIRLLAIYVVNRISGHRKARATNALMI